MTNLRRAAVAEAIVEVCQRARWSVDPNSPGPVPLDRLFQGLNVTHAAIPGLTVSAAARHLVRERYVQSPQIVEDFNGQDALAGLMVLLQGDGFAFIQADDILPRRRFSAAHELGHFVLHRDRMDRFLADEFISEIQESKSPMEMEADRFAADLLMPEAVCRARAAELKARHGCCPRGVLAYRLASELLVSQQAMRYRLGELGAGDE